MNITVYEATAHQFKMTLENMKNILVKANKWAEPKKIDMKTIFALRLAPDMLPLGAQIGIATDIAKGCFGRLTGQEIPKFEDKEVTLEDYINRFDKTIALLNKANPEMYIGFEDKPQEFPWYPGHFMNGKDYLLQQAIPNFYFHATTFYAILRNNGLDLGKGDFLGPIAFQKKPS